jgi:hypothetical protein
MASSSPWPTETKARRRRSATRNRGYLEGSARPSHPRHFALPQHPPRGTLPAESPGCAEPPGVVHFRIQGKRDKIRFVPRPSHGATADGGIPRACRPRARCAGAPLPAGQEQSHEGRLVPGARSRFRVIGISCGITAWPPRSTSTDLYVQSLRATAATNRSPTKRAL